MLLRSQHGNSIHWLTSSNQLLRYQPISLKRNFVFLLFSLNFWTQTWFLQGLLTWLSTCLCSVVVIVVFEKIFQNWMQLLDRWKWTQLLKCRSFNGRNRKSLWQSFVSFHRKEISYLVSLTSFGATVEWTIDSYFGGGEWNFKSS